MAEPDVQLLDIPAKVVVECTGFSLDIGGSVIKLVYRTKEDYEEAKAKKDGQTGKIRLVSFSRDKLPEAIKYIKEHVCITRDVASDENTEIFTTGIGCTQNAKIIRKELKCNPNNLMEFDCFCFCLNYLAKKLTRDQLLYPVIKEATTEPLEMLAETMAKLAPMMEAGLSKAEFVGDLDALTKAAETGHDQPVEKSLKPLAEAESIYPCLLAMCGSGFAFKKVYEDGKFEIIDGSHRGGRFFLGIGTLLTGCKDYGELVDLASRGNAKNIDVCTNDLIPEDSEDDLYSQFANDRFNQIVYSFGKGVGSKLADFSREDLAAAVLNVVAMDTVQTVFLTALVQKVKHVFFCGSFINTKTVRSLLTTQFTQRNAFMMTMKGEGPGIPYDFVKPGPHLGALGALINTVEKFLRPPAEVLAAHAATAEKN